jgi:hypothetical protein
MQAESSLLNDPLGYVAIQRAAGSLDRCVRTIKNLIDEGVIDGYRLRGGRTLYLKTSDIDKLFLKVEPTPPEMRVPRTKAIEAARAKAKRTRRSPTTARATRA